MRVADDDLAHHLGDPGDEVVVDVARDDRTRRGGAVLAGVDQRTGDRALDRGVEVGVVEHHERRLPAEFQLGAVAVQGGRGHHLAADRGGPGERHQVDVAMAGQGGADVAPGAGDDVEHPGGQTGLAGEPGQRQRGQRSQLGGLDHHRAAGGQRGQHLPHGHLQRVVPRGDGGDDADGLAPDARRVVAGVLRGGLALEMPRRAREEVDVVDAAGDVELGGQPHRLAGLADLLGDQVVGVLVGQLGQPGQHRRPVGGGGGGPSGQRAAGSGNGRVDVIGGGQGVLGDHATGRRIDDPVDVTRGRHRRAVDPAACHVRRHGHASTLTDHPSPGYAIRPPCRAETIDFICLVARNDGFRAQSLA